MEKDSLNDNMIHSSSTSSKAEIENNQPPKFQQFNGQGDPRQHIAHFVETCNNVGTDGDLLVKQFVLSLKGTAFDWYIDLEANSVDSWRDLVFQSLLQCLTYC
ncbi:UNVERIFIED_CONTAM: hypothetical protein Sradi_2064500 [Sesamum radiatum]|uniref:Retrotransposon gag protein n=1 Tax=Sesamum radiatum TaxID=300843 RepID=A0AAW2THQ6_SESRA